MSNRPSIWPYPALIAHRGAGKQAPENTLAAIRTGNSYGYKMMEYDVKLSHDQVAILLHDDDISRTSNSQGLAAELTLKELANIDFGAWHSDPFAGEPIATLSSIAAYTLANGIHSNIEIKPHTGLEAVTGAEVSRLAQKLWSGASLPPLLSSFSEVALEAAQKTAPNLPRALLIAKELPDNWQERVQRLGCIGLNLNNRYTTQAIVQQIIDASFTLAVWTVNDAARIQELRNWGCHAVFTDEVHSISPAAFNEYSIQSHASPL
ncbi:glycerophosphodiester phosphodiesterase [Alcaligenaceae bacterium]|nr:glycerophosphodiester phosphodiesterase [Alcaligenaceae bacterium]